MRHNRNYVYGPGGTNWDVTESGDIVCYKHNDEAWASAGNYCSGATNKEICAWLRDAYMQGMDDGKELIRSVLRGV